MRFAHERDKEGEKRRWNTWIYLKVFWICLALVQFETHNILLFWCRWWYFVEIVSYRLRARCYSSCVRFISNAYVENFDRKRSWDAQKGKTHALSLYLAVYQESILTKNHTIYTESIQTKLKIVCNLKWFLCSLVFFLLLLLLSQHLNLTMDSSHKAKCTLNNISCLCERQNHLSFIQFIYLFGEFSERARDTIYTIMHTTLNI